MESCDDTSQSTKKSKPHRKGILIICSACAIALIAAGGFRFVQTRIEDNLGTQLTQSERSAGKAYLRLRDTIQASRTAVAYTADDLGADGEIVSSVLRNVSNNAEKRIKEAEYKTVAGGGDATADDMMRRIQKIDRLTDGYRQAADDLNETVNLANVSHQARLLSDAMDGFTSALDKAKAKLSESTGNVDDESGRQRLQKLVDEAGSYARSTDHEALNQESKALTDAIGKVDSDMKSRTERLAAEQRAREQAAAEAAAAAASNAGYATSSGYSTTSSGSAASGGGHQTGASCNATSDTGEPGGGCQSALSGGTFLAWNYDDSAGAGTVYAQHYGEGGQWLYNMQSGSQVVINGHTYTVGQSYDIGYGTGTTESLKGSSSGQYALTCSPDGTHQRITPLN